MVVDDEISLRGIRVPAQTAVHPGSIREFGEELTQTLPEILVSILGQVSCL
jgi:hypothetical protein